MKRCKHKWNVFNGHPVHWRSFNRAPLRCEMATTRQYNTHMVSLSLPVSFCLSLTHSHTCTYTRRERKKKAPNIFCQQDRAYPQPSNNLLLCVYRVFGAKVSLNLSPQSQTSGKPQRNNVYFLSALALFLTMLSVHHQLVYLTNSPMICTSSLWKVTGEKTHYSWFFITCESWNNDTQLFSYTTEVL